MEKTLKRRMIMKALVALIVIFLENIIVEVDYALLFRSVIYKMIIPFLV